MNKTSSLKRFFLTISVPGLQLAGSGGERVTEVEPVIRRFDDIIESS